MSLLVQGAGIAGSRENRNHRNIVRSVILLIGISREGNENLNQIVFDMARDTKPGIPYFSHDVDMVNDLKIKILIAKYDLVAYGLYNRLLEEIYRGDGYFIKITDDFNILFSNDCKIELSVYIEMLNTCIEKGLFEPDLYKKYSILTSHRIQKNYFAGTQRRKDVEFIDEYMVEDPLINYNLDKVNVNIINYNVCNEEENAGTMSTESDEMSYTGTQSKVNKKVKQSKAYSDDSKEMRIAKYFFSVLQRSRENQSEPNWQNWCKEITSFLKKHNPTDQEIKQVIEYAHNPDNATEKFSWIPNLRSPKKLKEHFEKILLQSQNKTKVRPKNIIDRNQEIFDRYMNEGDNEPSFDLEIIPENG
jgi:hypothetical protein